MARRSWRSCVLRTFPIVTAALAGAAAVGGMRSQPEKPVTVIALGDTRFTDPANVTATSPLARAALIARIAEE